MHSALWELDDYTNNYFVHDFLLQNIQSAQYNSYMTMKE